MQPKKIIQQTASEGLGSCYERVQLYHLLPRILKGLDINSILETPTHITKGWDNIVLLRRGYQVAVGDNRAGELEHIWPYSKKPTFIPSPQSDRHFDLVWNFAILHQDLEVLDLILARSRRYILVFTPNILNWGTPIHWGLHLLTRTKCRHPEKGDFNLMTLRGLRRFLKKRGLNILKTGYFDSPPWPDFAFSKGEIVAGLPFLKRVLLKGSSEPQIDIQDILNTINKAGRFEKKLPRFLKPIWAHHQYILAEKEPYKH